MTSSDARKLVESEGFRILSYDGEESGAFFFTCEGDDGDPVEVSVINGGVIVAPT